MIVGDVDARWGWGRVEGHLKGTTIKFHQYIYNGLPVFEFHQYIYNGLSIMNF